MDEFKVNVNTNPGPAPDTEAPVAPAPESVISPMSEDPFKPDEAPVLPPAPKKSKGNGSGASKKILIVLLVLLLIGGAAYGVYYWQQKQVKDSQAQVTALTAKAADLSKQLATAQAATAKAADTKTANVFKIPELSIEMTVADSIKDLNYTLRNSKFDDGTLFIIADISSKTITDLDKNCASTATPAFGGLSRVDGTAPKTQATQTSQPVALKQFPNFYIGKASSQASCTTNKTVQDKITQLQKDYTTALGTIVLIK